MPPRPIVPGDDLYARLEVPPNAPFEAIEIAWRALLKRHHPDVAGDAALEAAKRINVAHDWLSNPELRARYDRERRPVRQAGRTRWSDDGPRAAAAPSRPPARPPTLDPAKALDRFLERVARLSRDELDRLSVAETTSIAFVASIHRFLAPDRQRLLDSVDARVRANLEPASWASGPIRDAVLSAAHELVLGPFLDEHLTEPSRGRARDRLMRGWEAAIDQPRYGPNTPLVERFLDRVARLSEDDVRTMVRASGRQRIPDDPWPRGLDPEEDEGLRVSTVLAGRDAAARASNALSRLDRPVAARATRLLARTGHAFVLRHGFSATQFAALVAPWTAATGDPGTGRQAATPAGPTVRRR